jgi:hypothetical protein
MVGLPVCECVHIDRPQRSGSRIGNCQTPQRVDEGLNPVG